MTTPDETLDTQGLLCPLPVLRARKRLLAMPKGARLLVLADDPVAGLDLPNFCREAGHELVSARQQEGIWRILIRRG